MLIAETYKEKKKKKKDGLVTREPARVRKPLVVSYWKSFAISFLPSNVLTEPRHFPLSSRARARVQIEREI